MSLVRVRLILFIGACLSEILPTNSTGLMDVLINASCIASSPKCWISAYFRSREKEGSSYQSRLHVIIPESKEASHFER
jgi:hypothetical protein